MPRIRSVHPGLTSDESFMQMSMTAKAAWPLLWMQCDDQGLFEWKPVVLKARIFPADNVDFNAVLEELTGLDCVKRIAIGGRDYGLVRNFGKWQRPKLPTGVVQLPKEHHSYSGLNGKVLELLDEHFRKLGASSDATSEVAPAQDGKLPQHFPSTSEVPSLREEEGGRRLDEGGERKKEVQPQAADPPPSQILEIAKTAWNELASDTGIPCVQNFNEARKRALVLRLGDLGGIEGFHALCGKIRGSPMLCGKNERGWKASFDWVLKPANLTKIMEGNYDAADNSHSKSKSIDDNWAVVDAVIAEQIRRENAGDAALGDENAGGLS